MCFTLLNASYIYEPLWDTINSQLQSIFMQVTAESFKNRPTILVTEFRIPDSNLLVSFAKSNNTKMG